MSGSGPTPRVSRYRDRIRPQVYDEHRCSLSGGRRACLFHPRRRRAGEGSTARQRCVFATLETLLDAVTAVDPRAPVAIIVGETVALAGELGWFEPDHDEEVEYAASHVCA